jgi:DNA-binding FadR family transcriptional regulator
LRQQGFTSGDDVPLRAVETVRLYRQIAGQIAELIDNGEFPPGSRLPPERELAAQLGVSRTSVREAVISLEIAGRVDVRVGTGIVVREPSLGPEAAGETHRPASDRGAAPFDLLQARGLIEGEICAQAAGAISAAGIAKLRTLVARMRKFADDAPRRDAADRAFHIAIAAATGNSTLTLTVEDLWDQRHGDLWTKLEQHFHTPALRKKTLADHEAILAALVARDAAAARIAMRRHLARVAEEFQRSIDRRPDNKHPLDAAPPGRAPARAAHRPAASRQPRDSTTDSRSIPAGTPRRGA